MTADMGISYLDYVGLTDFFCAPAYRFRTFFFDGKAPENQSLHDSVGLLDRFEVVFGEIVPRPFHCPQCKTKFNVDTQKGVDVALAVELVHLATAKHVELIVLVAGDRDFVPAVKAAKHEGTIVRLVHGSRRTYAPQLYQMVDERVEFSDEYLNSGQIYYERGDQTEIPAKVKKIKLLSEAAPRPPADPKVLSNALITILEEYAKKTSKHQMPVPEVGGRLKE